MQAGFMMVIAAIGAFLGLAACSTAGGSGQGDASAVSKKSDTPAVIREIRDGRHGGGHGPG